MPLTSQKDLELLKKLADDIDSTSILDLACDLLFVRGHEQIRITDGPGDGARDIHSIDNKGNEHITQCKYHNKTQTTVTSRELAELPIALSKFESTNGLFLTNTKISPQGKREYLNDYPKFNLDFVDGLSLIRELRMDPFLRARWIEGKGTDWSFILRFPVIVRRHSDDSPIIPELTYGSAIFNRILKKINKNTEQTIITGTTDFAGEEHFPSYREPSIPTQEEGLMPQLRCSLINCNGARTVAGIAKLQKTISDAFTELIKQKENFFSVCVGTPSLIPLSGNSLGNIILLNTLPLTQLHTPLGYYNEQEFFSLENSYWTSITDARATEADAIRLYSDSLDVCINISHLSQASRAQIRTNRALRLNMLAAWKVSKFAFVEFDPSSWSSETIPPPDEYIKWPWNDSWFCGWYHRNLLGGLITLPTAWHDLASFRSNEEKSEEERLSNLGKMLESLENTELLDPTRARHMLGSISYDPFSEEGESIFRTAELSLEENSGLPSPILPDRRNISATIFIKRDPSHALKQLIPKLGNSFLSIKAEYCVEKWEDCLRIDLKFDSSNIKSRSTSEILDELEEWFRALIDQSSFTKNEICTKLAWKKLTGVSLGVPWNQSENVYVSIPHKDGVREIRGIDNPLETDWNISSDDKDKI